VLKRLDRKVLLTAVAGWLVVSAIIFLLAVSLSYPPEQWSSEYDGPDARVTIPQLRDDLMAGNPEHLLEHWTYYLEREGGEFTVERTPTEISVTVHRCPAAAYLAERGIPLDPAFRHQTTVLNEALAEGTPFEVTTEVIDDFRYVQTIRKR